MEHNRYGIIQNISGSHIYVKLDGDSSITQCMMSASVPYSLLVAGKRCVVTSVRNQSIVTDVINEEGQDQIADVFNEYQVQYLTSTVNNTINQTINQVSGELNDPGLTSRRYFTHAARLTRDLLSTDTYLHVAIPSFSNDEILFIEQLPQGNFEYMLTTSGPETIQTGDLTEYRYSVLRGYYNTTPRGFPAYAMINGLSRTGFIMSDSRDSTRSPFLKVSVWSEPGNWSSEKEVFRVGNLNPILGITTPAYGFAAGDLLNGTKYISYNELSNSFTIKNTDILVESTSGPVFQVFADSFDPSYEIGSVILGNPNISSFRWTPSLSRTSIFIGNSEVIYFDPVNGSRITGVLSIGDITGPQIHVGKIEDQASIIARNSENAIKFNLSTLDDDIVMHIGNDISRPSGWMHYQAGILETRGAIIAESLVLTGAGTIPPGGTLTNFSEINVLEENAQDSAKLMIRPRYMEGRDVNNARTMIMAWNSISLPLDPNDPGSTRHTWIGGEMSLGDHRYRHFRVERGPNARVGLFDGDVGKAYLDAQGNLNLVGSITANSGTIGGWTIAEGHLYSQYYGYSAGMRPADFPFYAGHDTPAQAPFRVTDAGALTASNANITGWIGFGAGEGALDATGIRIRTTETVGGADLNSYRFETAGGVVTGYLRNRYVAGGYPVQDTYLITDGTTLTTQASTTVSAIGGTGYYGRLYLQALGQNAYSQAQITLFSEASGDAGTYLYQGGLTLGQATAKTASFTLGYNASSAHKIHYPVNATSGAVTATLPLTSTLYSSAKDGRVYSVSKIDLSANVVTVSAGSGKNIKLNGGDVSSIALTKYGDTVTLMSYSNNWVVIASNPAFSLRTDSPIKPWSDSTTALQLSSVAGVSVLNVDTINERIGVGTTALAAKLHVDQPSTTAAIPVLTVDQADVSEEFIRFIGTSTGNDSQSLINASTLGTPGTLKGWLRIYVQDDASSGSISDGVYFIPFYSEPTA